MSVASNSDIDAPDRSRSTAATGVRRSSPPLATLVVCIALVVIACIGGFLAPYASDAVDFSASLAPPWWQEGGSLAHVLGADQTGRDMLSRLLASARISLMIAFFAIALGGSIGVIIGTIAGYTGGVLDAVIMRVVDAFLAVPFILMALAIVAAVGPGLSNIIAVMVIANWPRYARLVRSEVIGVKGRDFVTLARIAGVSRIRIMWRHILPNALASVAALAALDVGRVIILESSLSFLGVGLQPPDVSWGLMLADGRMFLGFAWWLTTLPGLAIVITVLAFNSLGDWLRSRLDPRSAL